MYTRKALTLLLLAASMYASLLLAATTIDSRYSKLVIKGEDRKNGIYDISVEYGRNGIGWLVYSRVQLPEFVETRLAKSLDHGRTWRFVKVLNPSRHQTIVTKGRAFHGVWRYEVPVLLYDRNDVPARRWKLYTHRYYTLPPYKKHSRLFTKSWIEYRYARRPDGLWSVPVRLFGKPETGSRIDINALHPSLRSISFYSEMGAMVYRGTLYMSLDASATPSGLGKWRKRKIILIASKDHGRSWSYVNELTNFHDAKQRGYLALTGSSLVQRHGKVYLFVAPSGARKLLVKNRGHDGTYIIPFKDIRRGELARDADGRLVIQKIIKPGFTNGGLSDYHEQNTNGGILFSQINLPARPEFFQVYSTRIWSK